MERNKNAEASSSLLDKEPPRKNPYIGFAEIHSTIKVGDRRIFSPFLFHPDLVTESDRLIIAGIHLLVAMEQERGAKLANSVFYRDASKNARSKRREETGGWDE
jgi:hypothetical protein